MTNCFSKEETASCLKNVFIDELTPQNKIKKSPLPKPKENLPMEKKTVPELTKIAKGFGLVGLSKLRKGELVERINLQILHDKNATIIQKYYRRFCVVKYFNLLSKYAKMRDKCVNDTDFYTLEPLNNIPNNQFFSIQDSQGFFYGFSIFSLQLFFKKNVHKLNPYTREKLSESILQEIVSFLTIINVIFPDTVDINQVPSSELEQELICSIVSRPLTTIEHRFLGNRIYPRTAILSESQRQIQERLMTLRSQPINTRIQEVFMEMDRLVGYIQSDWFIMTRGEYSRFYRFLCMHWDYHGEIPTDIKYQICHLTRGEAFYNLMIPNMHSISETLLKEACLLVIENLVYTGVDEESRRLGTFAVLLAIANIVEVSRATLNWLL